MTNEAKDKLLRDKINALDPLSGGIVFGREEAWDKLQQRIEQKPAKKIAVKYWLAAAAVLLLFVSIVGIYYRPVNRIVNNTKENTNLNTVTAEPVNATAVIPQPESMQVTIAAPVVRNTGRHVTHIPASQNTDVVPAAPQDEDIDDNKAAAVNTPAPLTTSPQPVKVIHINDLERKTETQQPPAIAFIGDNPTIDVSKLPVIHINEVIRQDVEIKAIRRENRMSFGHRLFFPPSYNDMERIRSQQKEYYPSTNPLKAILNIQN